MTAIESTGHSPMPLTPSGKLTDAHGTVRAGRWGPMKQTALALSHLVATKFPQDALQIIGFGRYAMQLTAEELAGVEPDYVQGTNLQHALQLAGRHLRNRAAGNRQGAAFVFAHGKERHVAKKVVC